MGGGGLGEGGRGWIGRVVGLESPGGERISTARLNCVGPVRVPAWGLTLSPPSPLTPSRTHLYKLSWPSGGREVGREGERGMRG